MKFLLILLSIITTYEDFTYITVADVPVATAKEDVKPLVDRMVYEFQTNPELLFDWAFKGTGQQGDAEKDAIVLSLQEVKYNPKKRFSHMVFNINVDGKPKFKNIKVESSVADSLEGNTMLTRLDIDYKGLLFNTIYLNFRIKSINETNCRIVMDTHLKFGWFFNMFVSKKVYKQTLEWRVDKFMHNVKEMAETGEVKD